MNAERTRADGTRAERGTSVDGRASIHAALSEPVRLAIVESLLGTDLSPGRLAADLGVGTNLLAHHIGVLENAGIIARVRSEADGRRTHLRRLLPAHWTPEAPAPLPPCARIVFVCTGNSARSPLAAALWRRGSEVPATSAGTVPADRVPPRALTVARRHGIDLDGHVPRGIDDVLRDDDLVITVCDRARARLGTGRPADTEPPGPHWSVPNPGTAGTEAAYEAAYTELEARVGLLVSAR